MKVAVLDYTGKDTGRQIELSDSVFAIRNRDYSFKLNKNLKRLARKSAFSIQAKDQNILVIEDFNFEAPKTKEFVNVLKALELDNQKSLFVLGEAKNNVYLSSRNLEKSEVVTTSEVNTYKVLNAKKVVLLEGAIADIEANLSK